MSEATNSFMLKGTVAERPVLKQARLAVCELLLRVSKGQYGDDLIPAVAFGDRAATAAELPIGTEVSIAGRIGGYCSTGRDGRTWHKAMLVINRIEVVTAASTRQASAAASRETQYSADYGDTNGAGVAVRGAPVPVLSRTRTRSISHGIHFERTERPADDPVRRR